MILIGIGSNLAAPPAATPLATAKAALDALPRAGLGVIAHSAWHLSAPVPMSAQPWFVNAVIRIASDLPPAELLDRLLSVEADFGRIRGVPNAARTLDLDLLDVDGVICDTPTLVLPHPRLHLRRFVLEPLLEVAPEWRHPLLHVPAAALLAALPPGQEVHRLAD